MFLLGPTDRLGEAGICQNGSVQDQGVVAGSNPAAPTTPSLGVTHGGAPMTGRIYELVRTVFRPLGAGLHCTPNPRHRPRSSR
jgi:hypothetical protein